VRDGAKITRFWFAKKMPGPPVKILTTEADKTLETRELFSRHRIEDATANGAVGPEPPGTPRG
jgi:hypothetical protein